MIDSGDPFISYELCLHNARTGIAGADPQIIRELQVILSNPKLLVEFGEVQIKLGKATGIDFYFVISMECFRKHFPQFANFLKQTESNRPFWILKGEVHGLAESVGQPLEFVSIMVVCLGFERTYMDAESIAIILGLRARSGDQNSKIGSTPEVEISHHKVTIAENGNQKLETDGFTLAIPDCWEVLRGLLGVSADAWPLP
ncbi:MAG: hypothetical protein K8R88_11165 [Armatimonadetes bacterium]|nr:hypothetical protein [Armatimonadota bacterium]